MKLLSALGWVIASGLAFGYQVAPSPNGTPSAGDREHRGSGNQRVHRRTTEESHSHPEWSGWAAERRDASKILGPDR